LRHEQGCAQASSYDAQLFDNLAPQPDRTPARPWGKTVMDYLKAVIPPIPTLKGAYGAQGDQSIHFPRTEIRYEMSSDRGTANDEF
jgi:hypothetical protein